MNVDRALKDKEEEDTRSTLGACTGERGANVKMDKSLLQVQKPSSTLVL